MGQNKGNKNCYKLKGTGVSIGEDFLWQAQLIRKKLWNSTRAGGQNNEKVSLTFDKAKVNGQLFSRDDDRNVTVPPSKNYQMNQNTL